MEVCPLCHGLGTVSGRKPLTKRQREIVEYIRGYSKEKGFAPTYQEIADVLGFSSLSTVWEHIDNLQHKGWIVRHHHGARDLTLTDEAAA